MRQFSIIVAIAENNAIGKENQLLWHLSEDLKYFKKVTLSKTVVMGYKTWESLPLKPLPKRKNIVITSDQKKSDTRFTIAHSIEEVLEITKHEDECFVIGGGSIYRQFMPLASKLYVTHVHKSFEADTFFPNIDPSEWHLYWESTLQKDEQTGLTFTFKQYDKIKTTNV